MKEYSAVGKRVPRIDGVQKATGEAQFAADLILLKMLEGKILRSPYPHARILNIDASKASRLIGVKAAITGKDTPGGKFGGFGKELSDQAPLVLDKARYVGDEVAAVAAMDEDIAEEALELIDVEYEILPAVFDPEEAMKPGAPQIHDYAKNNICSKVSFTFGDIEQAFKESYLVREDKFVHGNTGVLQHCQIEPHAAVAFFDTSGKLTLWTPNMSPFVKRRNMAKTMKMPESMIRVARVCVGGAFGGKSEFFSHEFCSALLSKKTGKPVKIALTREEVFTATRQRHPMIIQLKTGVKRDGTLTAIDCKIIGDTGAYASVGPASITIPGLNLSAIYRTPNMKYEGYCVLTNKTIRGAMRGHGLIQFGFAQESQLDLIAEQLGMNPIEIKLKNAVKAGEVLPLGGKVISCGLTECINKAVEDIHWKEKWGKRDGTRGVGIGCATTPTGVMMSHDAASEAFIKSNEDGTITLLTGVMDTGTGSDTMLSQIAAEVLGLKVEDVKVTSADTDTCPRDVGSYIMAVAHVTGNAVKEAALDAKRQIMELVAEKLEASPEDLEFKDRRIYVRGTPEKGMTFKQALLTALFQGKPVLAKGIYRMNAEYIDFRTGKGKQTPTYSYSSQTAEVEVDRETGKVKFLRTVLAHDCGFALNPLDVEGQLQGGAIMAYGGTLLEGLLWEDGQILNPSFLDYKIPLSLDIPSEIKMALIETIDPEGPFGAKECGEGPSHIGPSCIGNAIYDATGIRMMNFPIIPEMVLESLEKKGG